MLLPICAVHGAQARRDVSISTEPCPLQVRTLVQQRDAAQDNTKKLAAELLKAQTQADKLYKEGGTAAAAPPSTTTPDRAAQGEASTSRHAVWHPSAERAAASRNAELVKVLREVAVNDEVAVAISNDRLAADGYMLEFWCVVVRWGLRAVLADAEGGGEMGGGVRAGASTCNAWAWSITSW